MFIRYVGHMTPNSVKYLYRVIIYANGYIDQSNVNKYLTIIPNDEGINTLKRMKKYGAIIKDLIKVI